jgi:cell division protein FtsQ
MSRERPKTRRNWRLWLMAASGVALALCAAYGAYEVRRFALTNPRFTLQPEALTIVGVEYASLARVERVFEADFGRSVFALGLAERRRRLMAIDWVREASVSRLWPNRLAVRVEERKPVAFVNLPLATGDTSVLLIDAGGLFLERPPQSPFAFPVLSGITESQTEAQRRLRVRAMLKLLADLGEAAGHVSEVNAADPGNLRVVTQLDGRPVELVMGDGNYAPRYQTFLAHFPEIRKRPEKTFDLRLDDRIIARD